MTFPELAVHVQVKKVLGTSETRLIFVGEFEHKTFARGVVVRWRRRLYIDKKIGIVALACANTGRNRVLHFTAGC